MSTLLRIDPAMLPREMTITPPLSDPEFELLCRASDSISFERTKEGVIRVKPPAGGWTADGNSEIAYQLRRWWAAHERGRVFDSSGGFRLPDGSVLNPDGAYASAETLKRLPKGELKGFPRLCPDFVIELLSESDSLSTLQAKMEDWMANGAQLGWLIDPYERQVYVYRPKQKCDKIAAGVIRGEGPVGGFVLDLGRVWKCYED
jgi:Uma2 family endonuclease